MSILHCSTLLDQHQRQAGAYTQLMCNYKTLLKSEFDAQT